MAASHHHKLLEKVRLILPSLSGGLHKGQAGRIAVLGGSFEYTGAPYYSAYSALKLGADLSHIFCDQLAATAIKSYSPELIVHPVLKSAAQLQDQESPDSIADQACSDVAKWFPAIHVLVVGPGMGRDALILKTASLIIQKARANDVPLVIDGDGLFLVCQDFDLIKGYKRAILTPNKVEFQRIKDKLFPGSANDKGIMDVCKELGNVTIVEKTDVDKICNGEKVLECEETGSGRRCGGQGDILTGCIATFMHWALREEVANLFGDNKDEQVKEALLLAGYAGSHLLRSCNKSAFIKFKRGTTTPDILAQIPEVVEHFYPADVAMASL